MKKYKLYGDSRSGNCYKAALIMRLTGQSFEWVETDVMAQATRREEFLALNPNGKVPLLQFPDGRCLAESNAILLHLSRNSEWFPKDEWQQALTWQWLFFEQYSHEPYIAVRRFRKKFMNMSDDELDPQLLSRGRRALGVMEMQLTLSNYFVGDSLTLADVALVAYTRVADEGGFDLNEFLNVQRWVARVETDLGIAHSKKAA